MRARQFFMELLSSERAFNGWNDEQAAAASSQHFGRLLEMMKALPDLLAYYPMHSRRGKSFLDATWKQLLVMNTVSIQVVFLELGANSWLFLTSCYRRRRQWLEAGGVLYSLD